MNTDQFSQYEPVAYLLKNAEKTEIPLVYKNKELVIDSTLPVMFLIVGPGGAGKDSITRPLINEGLLVQSRTATTRDCRVAEGESPNSYVWMRKKDENETQDIYVRNLIIEYGLIEHNEFNGFVYGIPINELEKTMQKGTPVLLIDPHGVQIISEAMIGKANVVIVFIVPESYEQLWNRMQRRENAEQRLQISLQEIKNAPEYAHYYLFNPQEFDGQPGLPQAQEALRKLIQQYVKK